MTRVIAGELGGRRLSTPPGSGTRPTSERVREAVFSSLEATFGGLHDLVVLDAFAGSGALGIEALSRGARHATLVEQDRRAAAVVRANVTELGLARSVDVIEAGAERLVSRAPGAGACDVVLLDPPYAYPAGDLADLLAGLVSAGWVADDAEVVVERGKREAWQWPAGFEAGRVKRYGETVVSYARRVAG